MEKKVGSHHLLYSDSLVIDSGSTSQQQKGAVGRNILTWLRDEKLSQYQEYSSLIFGMILILIFIFSPQGLGPLMKRIIFAMKPGQWKQKLELMVKRVKS